MNFSRDTPRVRTGGTRSNVREIRLQGSDLRDCLFTANRKTCSAVAPARPHSWTVRVVQTGRGVLMAMVFALSGGQAPTLLEHQPRSCRRCSACNRAPEASS